MGALLLGATTSGWAQGTCFPADSSNEAKTFAIRSVPLAYSGLGVATRDQPWQVWAALEVSLVPTIDSATRTPTFCRQGKVENANLLDAFPRPRVGLTLPAHFAIEASWVPPITVNDVTANLFGLALSWTYPIGATLRLAVRGHTTLGEIKGPITCPEEAVTDTLNLECFGGTVSDDRYSPNIFGVDATLGWAPGSGRWRPYIGGGYNRLQPRFQVHFVRSDGSLDDTLVAVDLNRAVVYGGLQWLPNAWLQVGGEVYAAPADEVTGRIFLKAYLN